ncbi:MAG TPA: hypothetical protein VFI31_02505 [Pirellulales bacterium]|nr:hypothetical protein [Pirellulales bacterium]
MTIQQLRAVYDAQPFRPFNLHVADGRSIRVQHRDFMMTVPRGRTIVVAEPDGRLHILDLLMVTEVELLAAPNNGSGKRRRGP